MGISRSCAAFAPFASSTTSISITTEDGSIRLAPILDLGGAFGSGGNARKLLSSLDKGTYFLVYFLYGDFRPEWDYSWYDPSSLEGFEEEMRETLSKSEFYTPDLIEGIVGVYLSQKRALEERKRG